MDIDMLPLRRELNAVPNSSFTTGIKSCGQRATSAPNALSNGCATDSR